MAKTFLEKLKNGIGTNNIFSLADAAPYFVGNDDALKEAMHRASKTGAITRLGYGVYIFKEGKLSDEELNLKSIEFRYLGSGKNIIGFLYGPHYVDSLLKRPFPKKDIDIVSNKVTSGKKSVYQFGQRIVLRKPYVPVTKDNVDLVAFLTYISYASKEELKKNEAVVANFVRTAHLSAIEASMILDRFPAKTSLTLLNGGFYKIMWRH